ncbi:hypothetical protein [Okeania sp. SIO2B3]|uniref:hypothetical protein n=1 Tax=Okeania sp. SIO2B3 TaxID=2607784 RepID=UPI0013C17016|nr:hypothetical protein [Okeania sp. SIO2B3]NET47000.1 hypothetical protein [Okeania sp. SIO2B3]
MVIIINKNEVDLHGYFYLNQLNDRTYYVSASFHTNFVETVCSCCDRQTAIKIVNQLNAVLRGLKFSRHSFQSFDKQKLSPLTQYKYIDEVEIDLYGYFSASRCGIDAGFEVYEARFSFCEGYHEYVITLGTFYDQELAVKTIDELNKVLRGLKFSKNSFQFFDKKYLEVVIVT